MKLYINSWNSVMQLLYFKISIRNFISRFTGHMITYPCWSNRFGRRGLRWKIKPFIGYVNMWVFIPVHDVMLWNYRIRELIIDILNTSMGHQSCPFWICVVRYHVTIAYVQIWMWHWKKLKQSDNWIIITCQVKCTMLLLIRSQIP